MLRTLRTVSESILSSCHLVILSSNQFLIWWGTRERCGAIPNMVGSKQIKFRYQLYLDFESPSSTLFLHHHFDLCRLWFLPSPLLCNFDFWFYSTRNIENLLALAYLDTSGHCRVQYLLCFPAKITNISVLDQGTQTYTKGIAKHEVIMARESDPPIALRKKRRSCVGVEIQSPSNSQAPRHDTIQVLIPPPTTPRRRPQKKARFSDVGPNIHHEASSGLTPFFRKTSISSANSNRRHSAPVRLVDRRQDNEPFSGELQFAPLHQVLDGRVVRRMRRSHLSEETNKIGWEKKLEARARFSEISRLRKELKDKDHQLQCVQDEHDAASQLKLEDGTSLSASSTVLEKFHEMEKEIEELKTELSQKSERLDSHHDWQAGAQDPFDFDDDDDDDHNMNMSMVGDHGSLNIEDYDVDMSFDPPGNDQDMNFNSSFSNASDLKINHTQHDNSIPSPPATIADTYSHKSPCETTSTQANFPDPINAKLEAQLVNLQSEINCLTAALARNKDHEYRISQKLSSHMPSDYSFDNSTLDSALDSVLTALTQVQAQALEKEASFKALSTEVTSLGFSKDAETTINVIAEQFRAARLELKHLTPGEVAEGFENDKLLGMLLGRLKNIVEKVKKQDETIDQYHEQEIILRQQLTARIESLQDVQKELSAVSTVVSRMSKEVAENEISNSRLQTALNGYRKEVSGLEKLVEKIERDHTAIEADLREGIHNMDDQLQREIFRAEAFSAELEGKNMIVGELSTRLRAALKSSAALQDLLNEKEGQLLLLNRQNDEGLTDREVRIAELQEDLERATYILKSTQRAVENLRQENSDLKTENEDLEHCVERLKGQVISEKRRGQKVVEGMRKQLMGVMDLGRGYMENDDSATEAGESNLNLGVAAMVVKKGQFAESNSTRRKSGAVVGKKKKRRYDSGLGFLEEEENEDDDMIERDKVCGEAEEMDIFV